MSLLVRAAILGGLAYVVSRAVRHSQHSLDSSRSGARRLSRTADEDLDVQDLDVQPQADRLSTPSV